MNANKIHRFLVLLFLVYLHGSARANDNPIDTLPKTEPQFKTDTLPFSTDSSSRLAEQIRQKRAIQLKPARFGIQGARAIPFKEVSAFFAHMANQLVTVGALVDTCQEVTKLYHERGYSLSFCYVPEQNFNNEMINIVIVEGFVDAIKVTGNPGNSEAKIRELLSPLLAEKPLTRATMERYTNMLSLLPGMKLSASLPLPKRKDGATEISVDVRRKRVDLIGRLEMIEPTARGILTAKTSGNSKYAEEITVSTLISRMNEEYYAATYSQPIGNEGLILKVEAQSYDGDPKTNLGDDVERNINSLRVSTTLSYPFILRKDKRLIGTVSLTGNNYQDTVRSKAAGRQVATDTNVRSLSTGFIYSEGNSRQARRLQLTLSRGLDSLGAEKSTTSNFTAGLTNPVDLEFNKFVLSFIQRNYFGGGWGTSISALGQYSPSDLPVTERVIFGGFQFGRAFRPGRISGDSGWGVGLEFNRTIPVDFQLPYYEVNGLQPYVLLESARIFENRNTQVDDRLSSLSLGLRLLSKDPERSNIDLTLSKALRGSNSGDFAFGVNFGLPLN